MPASLLRRLALTALAVAIALPAVELMASRAAITVRTVYLAAIDSKGALVTNLAADEIVVRENRQVRDVAQLEPATEQLHVAVLVDDGGEGGLQAPVSQLVSVLSGRAVFSISVLNPQPYRLNDYSADDGVLRRALSRLVQRGRVSGDPRQMSEAVSWAGKDLQKRELARPVIVVLVTSTAAAERYIEDEIVEDLRVSGASLHVVYAGGIQMGRVLMEGPTRSGGSHIVANSTGSFGEATIGIGRMLARQYKLTYVLPDGVKPHADLQVTTTRPGVKIVAPTRIPTK